MTEFDTIFSRQGSDVKPGVDGKTYLFLINNPEGKKRGIINASVKLPSKTKKEEMERRKIIEKTRGEGDLRGGKKKRTAKAANSPEAKESELKGGGMKLARENPGRKQIRHPGKSEDKRKKMIEEENQN